MENEYGITLVSLDEKYRTEYEPYPTPNIIKQDLMKILNKISFVDRIIFGKTNYNKKISEYRNYKEFYNECAEKVIEFCEKTISLIISKKEQLYL